MSAVAHTPSSASRDVFPLSVVQESLWIEEQRSPGTAAYNVPEAWRLSGELNVAALDKAFELLIRRHETLRTAFVAPNGIPEQHVFGSAAFRIGTLDLSASADREKKLIEHLASSASQPFRLGDAPLIRADLFRLSSREHVLLINLHHLVADAWSQRLLMRDLTELYAAAVSGRSPQLPELSIQYGDFAAWQRECLTEAAAQKDLAYWADQLKGPLPLVSLPPDRERPNVQRRHGATQFCRIAPELTRALEELSRAAGTTLFVTLLSAFKVLLSRYSRQHDVIVGVPMAGRDLVETEDLVGMFVNTHALRTNLEGDPTFSEVLGRVRTSALNASAHQHVSLETIVRALQPERSANRHPLFQVVFGLQGASPARWEMPGVVATRHELDNGASKFDWTVLATREGDELSLRSEFDSDLFDADTVTRAVDQFQKLLESAARSPHSRISELSMLTDGERERVVVEFNRTGSSYERDLCVHELFEKVAAEHADRVALVLEGRQMTYGELNARADDLCARLQLLGVQANAPVAVCMERSFEVVIAMLGILKAGAGYVPLDPGYPAERLKFMLQDSGVEVVVSNSGLTSRPEDPGRFHIVKTDCTTVPKAVSRSQSSSVRARPEDLAYIIYTSGSTGTPKGTRIPHRAIVRLVRNTNYADFRAEDVFLHLSSVSFDASTLEVWASLLNGARLVLFPPRLPSLEELGRTISTQGITVLWLTAGLFNRMVDEQLAALRGVRVLMAGGEALSVPHVVKALRGLPHTRLVNGYGPTENTTFTCCYQLPKDWCGGVSVPIGRPISHSTVYILDQHLKPVPVGVPGELFAGGDGLALGYQNQPELTSEKFVASPFKEGTRLYRTGDLARWLKDGAIEFMGRLDEQVKIRGFRVEPGEIELALEQHASVRQAVVVARPDRSGTKVLIAYVLPQTGQKVSVPELRAFLEQKLPLYLVPSHLVPASKLPLTDNGKVDRRALADMAVEPEPVQAHVPPRTPIEKRLVAIWNEVLGRNSFGIHENFFHLGGHSLLATQVVSRVGQEWNVELPVSVIFEAPTIAQLALRVEAASRAPSRAGIRRRLQAEAAQELLSRMDELTESQIEELLNDPDLKHFSS